MTAPSVIEIVENLEEQGIDVWLDGGWGVDALLERETRTHDDLDLVVELSDSEHVLDVIAGSATTSSSAGRRRASSASIESAARWTSTPCGSTQTAAACTRWTRAASGSIRRRASPGEARLRRVRCAA
jgi:hypothetical protein